MPEAASYSPENRSLISLSTFVGESRFLDTLLT